jgi:hypothetical protein
MSLLPTAPIASIAELREHIARGQTDLDDGLLDDGVLVPLANGCVAQMETYCDRTLIAPAAAEVYSFYGSDDDRLRLWLEVGALPIAAITSVVVDGETVAAQPDSDSDGYRCGPPERRRGEIRLYGTTAGADDLCVVTARCGYAKDHATLLAATTITAAEARDHERGVEALRAVFLDWCRYLHAHHTPSAETIEIGGMSANFSERDMPARVKAALAPFRRLVVS